MAARTQGVDAGDADVVIGQEAGHDVLRGHESHVGTKAATGRSEHEGERGATVGRDEVPIIGVVLVHEAHSGHLTLSGSERRGELRLLLSHILTGRHRDHEDRWRRIATIGEELLDLRSDLVGGLAG